MDFPPHYHHNWAPDSLTQPGLSLAGHQQPPVQQTQRPYSIGDTYTFGREANYQVGKAEDLRFHVQQPFGLFTVHPSDAQHDTHSNGSDQGAFAYTATSSSASAPNISFTTPANPSSPIGPPTQSRKRKAPTLREADWEPYKARILDLYTLED